MYNKRRVCGNCLVSVTESIFHIPPTRLLDSGCSLGLQRAAIHSQTRVGIGYCRNQTQISFSYYHQRWICLFVEYCDIEDSIPVLFSGGINPESWSNYIRL